MKTKTPALYEYAIQLLAIPADDGAPRRIFKTIDRMITEDDSQIHDAHFGKLVIAKLLSDLELHKDLQ